MTTDVLTGHADLMSRAVGWRTGAAAYVGSVPRTPADPVVEQYAAASQPVGDTTPAGGAGRTAEAARAAAIGELLERYAGARCRVPLVLDEPGIERGSEHRSGCRVLRHDDFSLHSPEQRAAPQFPYTDSYRRAELTWAHSLADNQTVLVPANLVSNHPDLGTIATSNGLAAGPTTQQALLRASQELVERDALLMTWLHQVSPATIPMPSGLDSITEPFTETVTLFDITPAYSPHPVVLAAGSAPLEGRDRNAVGLACRATVEEAAEKAALEWAQSTCFAGVKTITDPPGMKVEPADVRSFDDHALFYTRRPDLWATLALWGDRRRTVRRPATGRRPASVGRTSSAGEHPSRIQTELTELIDGLTAHGIDVYYRDLTVSDVAACGVRVVRVLSPHLVPIHSDHRWPHLGGTASQVGSRYPDAAPEADPTGPTADFPSTFPHPLG